MKIITVEEHFTTPEAAKIITDYKATLPNQDKIKADDAAMTAGMVAAAPNVEEMIDVDQLRIDYMDKNHIDMQVVSAAGITPQLLPDNLSIDACRDLNDALAKHIANHPDRFVGFATLPANNPAAAATELNRAVTELGLKGALFSGTINGEFLSEARFFPIFEMAAKLDVPLYIHPGYPTEEETNVLYKSDSYNDAVKSILSTPGFGWHMEAGIQIIRLIFSGIFDKLPNLKLISGHWGEFVPTFLNRLDEMTAPVATGLKKSFSEYYRNNIYITPSGIFEYDQMLFSLNRVGADHILWSEDYPFVKSNHAGQFLEEAPISPESKEKIAHENVEKLLHLD